MLAVPQAREVFKHILRLARGDATAGDHGGPPRVSAEALHPAAADRADVLGVLFVTNVGVELALWTLGVAVVSGTAGWSSVRRACNPPAIAVVAALALLAAGGRSWIPGFLDHALGTLAACAVPVALLMIGALICDGVTFTPALAELIPQNIQSGETKAGVIALMERWQPGGVGDLRLRARRKAADAEATNVPAAPSAVEYALEIEPRTLSLVHGDTPLSFEQVSGRATVRPGRVELDELTGVFATGRAAVNGDVGL